MRSRQRSRVRDILTSLKQRPTLYGSMRGTARGVGGIVAPAWDDGPWDAEPGIAYHGDNGPVYWVRGN